MEKDKKSRTQLYEENVLPKLTKLIERCRNMHMPLLAGVDVGEGVTSVVMGGIKEANISMVMAHYALRSGGDFDAFLAMFLQHCNTHDIEVKSEVLPRLADEEDASPIITLN